MVASRLLFKDPNKGSMIMTSHTPAPFIRWFDELGIQDIPVVGGKNASLGELRRSLAGTSINVPDGFAVTANAYRAFLTSNYLDELIRGALVGLDTRDIQ